MTKCGFCGIVGHKIRQCNSERAAEILAEYREIITEDELDTFLRRHISASLSIILISYGSSSTSISRMEKIEYIRLHWIQELVNSAIAPALPLVQQAPFAIASHMSRRVFLQFTADSIFERACILFGGQSEMFLAANLYPLFSFIGESIVMVTGDSYSALDYVSKKIFQKLQIPRNTPSVVGRRFYNSCMLHAFQIATQVRLNVLIEHALLNPELEPDYVPHKPQFKAIQVSSDSIKKAQEYSCGICGDEHTQDTLPTLGCDHTLCYECITGQIIARTKSCITCPFCRQDVITISVQDVTIQKQISTLVASEIANNNPLL